MMDNSVSSPADWTFRKVVWATLVSALVVFCFYLIYRFYEVLFILLISIIFGTIIRPVANWLYQRGVPRVAGVILVYVIILLLLVGFLWLIFPVLFQQGATVARELPGYYNDFRASFINSSNPIVVRLGYLLPASLPGFQPVSPLEQDVVTSAERMWTYILLTANAVFTTILILVLTLYWTIDGPRIIKSLLLLFPPEQRDRLAELIASMEAKIVYFIVGQTILCFSIGFMALIAYLIIGLPNAIVLALAAGVLEVIPMLGPALGAIPAGLVALSIGFDKFVWVIVAMAIIQQLENNYLVPRIMDRTVGVNPFVTLLSLFAFGLLFGIPGALMAIPIAAIIQLILNHFVFKQTVVELEPDHGRNYVSRLRYEAQDLIKDLRKQARHKKHGSDEKIVQVEEVMDGIESITENLDALLSQVNSSVEE